jgi:hypothetical protein
MWCFSTFCILFDEAKRLFCFERRALWQTNASLLVAKNPRVWQAQGGHTIIESGRKLHYWLFSSGNSNIEWWKVGGGVPLLNAHGQGNSTIESWRGNFRYWTWQVIFLYWIGDWMNSRGNSIVNRSLCNSRVYWLLLDAEEGIGLHFFRIEGPLIVHCVAGGSNLTTKFQQGWWCKANDFLGLYSAKTVFYK